MSWDEMSNFKYLRLSAVNRLATQTFREKETIQREVFLSIKSKCQH